MSGKSSNQPGYRIQMTSCVSGTQLVLFSPDLFKNGSKYLFQTKSISFTAKTLPQILEFIYLPRACIFFISRYYMCDPLSTYLLLILKQQKLKNVLFPVYAFDDASSLIPSVASSDRHVCANDFRSCRPQILQRC